MVYKPSFVQYWSLLKPIVLLTQNCTTDGFIQQFFSTLYAADSYNIDQCCTNPDSYYSCFQHCTNPWINNVQCKLLYDSSFSQLCTTDYLQVVRTNCIRGNIVRYMVWVFCTMFTMLYKVLPYTLYLVTGLCHWTHPCVRLGEIIGSNIAFWDKDLILLHLFYIFDVEKLSRVWFPMPHK